ncbi:serine hydrolase domain-containing protein [Empedobacter brevis]|uniref:serine hydrolase domain-containing protein n=1 Tax=Empedobacter brevis TaxID=247 RepID=UPI002FE1BBC5
MKNYTFNLITCIFLFSNFYLNAQNIQPEKMNDYIDYIEKNNMGIGCISIFKNGNETYTRNFGNNHHQTIIYHVGSITKLFTATLIFKLIEQNKIALHTKLNTYFPEIKNSDKITIQNLLEHSSGLNNYVKKDEKTLWLTEPRTESDIFTEIKKQRILFSPTDSISYSNSGYFLLGKIIEKESAKDYGKVLKKYFTKPLKLKNTKSEIQNPRKVSDSYTFKNNEWITTKDFYFKNIIGVGDISSTPRDLNNFINALFDNKVVSNESVNKMKPLIRKENYGRGLMTFNFHGIDFYGNTGGTYGTKTILIHNEKSKISIALVLNGERFPRDKFITDIVNIIFNHQFNYPSMAE